MQVLGIIALIFTGGVSVVVTFFCVWWAMSWNIPIVVLRMVGDRDRPMAIFTKGKKIKRGGIYRLFVRGYNIPYRDFSPKNYFPHPKSKFGALILWEFKPGHLTPTIPYLKGLSDAHREKLKAMEDRLTGWSGVTFDFDDRLYRQMVLKAVDDVDIDIMVEEIKRVDRQYVGGLRDFFLRYGGHISLVIVCIILLVIVIVGLEKAPEIAKACANSASEVAKSALSKAAAAAAAPGG